MARIRSIKPEWLESESLIELGSDARLLSVSLMLLSDDWGNCKASPKLVGARVWPFLGPDGWQRAEATIAELESIGYLTRYSDGKYLHINGWYAHQKVDNPGRPQVPVPQFAIDNMPELWAKRFAAVRLKFGPKIIGETPAKINEIPQEVCEHSHNPSEETREPSEETREPSESSPTLARVSPTSAIDLGPRTLDLGSRIHTPPPVASVPLVSDPSRFPAAWYEQVWARYRHHHPRSGLMVPSTERDAMRAAFRAGRTPDELCQVIDGYHADDWYSAKASRLRLRSLIEDDAKITEGLEYFAKTGGGDASAKFTRGNLEALATDLGLDPEGYTQAATLGAKAFDGFGEFAQWVRGTGPTNWGDVETKLNERAAR